MRRETYKIQIDGINPNANEEEVIKGEQLLLHHDLIRGWTANPVTANNYVNFMNSIIGRYVTLSIDVLERELISSEISDEKIREYGDMMYMASNYSGYSHIESYTTDNGDYVALPNALYRIITGGLYDTTLLERIFYLFDPTIHLIKPMKENQTLIDLRQCIFDGLTFIINDFHSRKGNYYIDTIGVIKYVIQKLEFL